MTSGRDMLLALVGLGCGCIVPDTQIQVQPNRTNPGTVRIVQGVALSDEANAACAEVPGFAVCPLPSETIVPGLIDPDDQAFCTCEGGGRDANALGGFDIFVQDPDVDGDGEPRDTLLGAFLLDVEPGVEPISQFVAYTNYFPTNRPALPYDPGYEQAIERPAANLRSWRLGTDSNLDLCNDNNGTSVGPGLHSLRLIVTDRPWPFPVLVDEVGQPQTDDDRFVRDEAVDPLVGVPDLPGGASFDVADFIFRCVDETSAEGANVCNCEEVAG